MLLLAVASPDQYISNLFSSAAWPLEELLRLTLAGIFGAVIGLEREVRGRRAGFRTYLLVCLGSALVMLVSIQFATHRWIPQTPNEGVNINVDPAHVAYGVIVGIGFLGAGTIINTKGEVHGLTTAAGLWCSAAVGLAVGFGMYTIALMATLQILAALWLLEYVEYKLPKMRFRTITVRTRYRKGCVADTVKHFQAFNLRVLDASFRRDGDLTKVEIDLRIGFRSGTQYFELEAKLEDDPDYDLIRTEDAVA